MSVNELSRPLVRYHGGKWMLAPWIIGHFPAHRVYVEPFGGGASVLLRKARSYAEVYNDLDWEIVNLFKVVRDQGEELRRALELTPFSRVELENAYADGDTPLEQARRTIIRAYMGFGSNSMKLTNDGRRERMGFRANSNKSGSTPAADWRWYPASLGPTIERLRGVVIENTDATDLLRDHDSEQTLFYVDPPYVAATRGKGHDYRHEMTEEQHTALLACLRARKGYVIVSGYASELYDDMLRDWRRVTKETFADGAASRTEVLWISPNCPRGTLL